jgi:hypothetical protein
MATDNRQRDMVGGRIVGGRVIVEIERGTLPAGLALVPVAGLDFIIIAILSSKNSYVCRESLAVSHFSLLTHSHHIRQAQVGDSKSVSL